MNTIFTDYSTISELEINKRISYYDHHDFTNELIKLLIPDVDQYIKKIFYCLHCAEQCRIIIEDICKQTIDYRKKHGKFVNSISYNIGSLYVDGRAFVQQNVHYYCQYIAEINDCFFQILNIVYGIGKRQWDIIKREDIREHLKNKTIIKISEKLHSIIKLYLDLNNFAKHNLILGGKERFSPECMFSVEYILDLYDEEFKVSDFINISQERLIKVTILELLDNIFNDYTHNNQYVRKYVSCHFNDMASEGEMIFINDTSLSTSNNFDIYFETVRTDGIIKVVAAYCNHIDVLECPDLYLARLEQNLISSIGYQIKLCVFNLNEFDVLRDGKKVGKYVCKNKKDQSARYFHFKKFEFVKL